MLSGGRDVLSDEEFKDLQENGDPYKTARSILHRGAPYKEAEIQFLNDFMDDKRQDVLGAGAWKPERVEGFMDGLHKHYFEDISLDDMADLVKNHQYKYRPAAKAIDPSIDTKEKQIGVMAQDLEKVNPAVVEEDGGAKVVDTGKLALMSAGHIAELARKVKELESKLGG